jgi:hypothetical protein
MYITSDKLLEWQLEYLVDSPLWTLVPLTSCPLASCLNSTLRPLVNRTFVTTRMAQRTSWSQQSISPTPWPCTFNESLSGLYSDLYPHPPQPLYCAEFVGPTSDLASNKRIHHKKAVRHAQIDGWVKYVAFPCSAWSDGNLQSLCLHTWLSSGLSVHLLCSLRAKTQSLIWSGSGVIDMLNSASVERYSMIWFLWGPWATLRTLSPPLWSVWWL